MLTSRRWINISFRLRGKMSDIYQEALNYHKEWIWTVHTVPNVNHKNYVNHFYSSPTRNFSKTILKSFILPETQYKQWGYLLETLEMTKISRNASFFLAGNKNTYHSNWGWNRNYESAIKIRWKAEPHGKFSVEPTKPMASQKGEILN